jgi:1,4-dihydroxy-2-naphthoate octaprenyltransferase
MEKQENRLVLLLKLSRPYLLLASLLMVLLGVGIARYLNHAIDGLALWFGLLWVLAVQLGAQYLHEYFDLYVEADSESHTRFFGGSPVLGSGEDKLPRRTALNAAVVSLTIAGGLTFMLLWYAEIGLSSILLMTLIFGSALAYSLPPLRLSRSGYGELLAGLFFGFLVPAFSFDLQAGEVHRLVTMVSVPVVLLAIPMMLALSFPTYSTDRKYRRTNMLQKVGWQNSMMIHNTLILFSYLSLAGIVLLGFPRGIGMTILWSFPLGVVQTWLMGRVAAGAKPAWGAIRYNAISMVGLMVVLFTISFWIR